MPPAAKLKLVVRDADPTTRARLAEHREALLRLARLAGIETSQEPVPRGSLQVVVDEATFAVPLAGVIDLEQERQRLDKELAKARGRDRALRRRSSPIRKFLDRAPAEVVETQRARRAEVEQTRQKLEAALRADRVLSPETPMLPCFVAAGEADARPVAVVPAAGYAAWLARAAGRAARLAEGHRLRAQARQRDAPAGAGRRARGRAA